MFPQAESLNPAANPRRDWLYLVVLKALPLFLPGGMDLSPPPPLKYPPIFERRKKEYHPQGGLTIKFFGSTTRKCRFLEHEAED